MAQRIAQRNPGLEPGWWVEQQYLVQRVLIREQQGGRYRAEGGYQGAARGWEVRSRGGGRRRSGLHLRNLATPKLEGGNKFRVLRNFAKPCFRQFPTCRFATLKQFVRKLLIPNMRFFDVFVTFLKIYVKPDVTDRFLAVLALKWRDLR